MAGGREGEREWACWKLRLVGREDIKYMSLKLKFVNFHFCDQFSLRNLWSRVFLSSLRLNVLSFCPRCSIFIVFMELCLTHLLSRPQSHRSCVWKRLPLNWTPRATSWQYWTSPFFTCELSSRLSFTDEIHRRKRKWSNWWRGPPVKSGCWELAKRKLKVDGKLFSHFPVGCTSDVYLSTKKIKGENCLLLRGWRG